MNSGLYAFAGDSATATDAAWAKRLDEPMTNVSNMYFGLSRLPPDSWPGRRPGPLSVPPSRCGSRRGSRCGSRLPSRCGRSMSAPLGWCSW
jgi:hypothetical protein